MNAEQSLGVLNHSAEGRSVSPRRHVSRCVTLGLGAHTGGACPFGAGLVL